MNSGKIAEQKNCSGNHKKDYFFYVKILKKRFQKNVKKNRSSSLLKLKASAKKYEN
tara:strand:- start:1652 stop:1819 length:168 start_codon:yes stop_codon:yes gene_type:complete